MADNATGAGTTPNQDGADPLKNVKAEFDRKIGNLDGKISSLEQTNKALLDQLKSMAPPKQAPAAQGPGLKDVWYDKPEEAAARIKQEAKDELRQELRQENAMQQQATNTLNQLVAEFPELSNGDHELTKKAVEIYNAMPENEKSSPASYKAAVRQAAMELDVKPKSKRENYEDDFSIGGSQPSSRDNRSGNRRRGGLDPATEDFARKVGVNIDDPKVKERLQNNHGRKRYDRWE